MLSCSGMNGKSRKVEKICGCVSKNLVDDVGIWFEYVVLFMMGACKI